MRYLIDTGAYSAFNRGDGRLSPVFSSQHDLFIPLIVVGKLQAGFAAGSRAADNNRLLQRFLDAPNVNTLTLSATTCELYAATYLKLRRVGRPIGSNDLWIAALSLEHGLTLATDDSDFAAIDGLTLAKI